ncbi:hypothetical protein [Streptomyces sp. NPDC016845]|uniref:hypothetical protein n=1 Tax=Streptomyces sp. NPDC016845 TaxID=3364972 RepID=UPI0037892E9F
MTLTETEAEAERGTRTPEADRTAEAPETPGPPLRTRPGLHCAPVAGGVYFNGTRGQFVLRGSDILYAVADVCLPLLEAGTTENALVAEFGTERARPAVRHLVTKLRENGLLLDAATLTTPEPPAALRAPHAESLARLAAHLDDPYAAFARLRRTSVELRGPATAVDPARRGLHRAGVARTTVTAQGDEAAFSPLPAHLIPVCDPAMYADPALLPVGDPAVHGGPAAPRAVIEFLDGDGDGDGVRGGTWAEEPGTVHVPVLLGPGIGLVGPVGARPAAWRVLRDRALAWARAEGVGPAAGPVAHSLAGALAAQLLADTLTGVAEPGEAHVVHGPGLTADRITVAGAPATEAVTVVLDDAPAEPLPDPEDVLEPARAVTARWTGLFALPQGERLPQMPLALRAAEHRADRTGTVLAWAGHQEAATVAAALAALRDRAREGPGTPAAGLTREHWLLDGVLRQLAPHARELATRAVLDPEAERILDALRTHLAPAAGPDVTLSRADGVDWFLAAVTVAGRRLGAGWGATAAEAAHHALGTALAVAQTDGATVVPPLSTDALSTTDAATRAALRAQLTALAAYQGATYQGHAHRTDPVLGEVPFWYGPVIALPAQEPTDADD